MILSELWINERPVTSSRTVNTVEQLVLSFGSVSAVPGRCSGIDEALEAIGEISHAENMEYSSDAQSSFTQALLTNLGVCLLWRGGRAAILGPLTLTLLTFG